MNDKDTIYRQAAIDEIVNTVSEIGLHDNSEVARYGATFRQHEIIDVIEALPSAQPERKKGKWDTFFYDSYKVHKIGVECSCCGYRTQERTNYCPDCGAAMMKGETDE